jgi:hypothetical protein
MSYTDDQFMQALGAFEEQHGATSAAQVAAPQAVNICGIYKTVAPILKGLAPFIAAIPGIGAPAAAAIAALTGVLDAVCAGSGPQFAAAGGQDQEFMRALGAFQQGGSSSGAMSRGQATGTVSAQAADLCGTWKQVRPILKGLLPALRAIPVLGSRIAKALEALMAGLDAICPVS